MDLKELLCSLQLTLMKAVSKKEDFLDQGSPRSKLPSAYNFENNAWKTVHSAAVVIKINCFVCKSYNLVYILSASIKRESSLKLNQSLQHLEKT